MDETYVPGYKGDASVLVGTWSSVLEVTLYDCPVGCQLTSDLVMTACQEFYFYQPVPLCRAEKPVSEFRQLGLLASLGT